jgi:ankyrin repeat protein
LQALHYAFAYGYEALAGYLLDAGADVTITNNHGDNPRPGLVLH